MTTVERLTMRASFGRADDARSDKRSPIKAGRMPRRFRPRLASLMLYTVGAWSQQPDAFADLKKEVDIVTRDFSPARIADIATRTTQLVDCDGLPYASDGPGPVSQYIFNGVYSWHMGPHDSGYCAVMDYPQQKMLSRVDATYLLTASQIEFPMPPSPPVTAIEGSRPNPDGVDQMPTVVLPPGIVPAHQEKNAAATRHCRLFDTLERQGVAVNRKCRT